MFPFLILKLEKGQTNQLGEPVAHFKESEKVNGWLDLITGSDEQNYQNSMIPTSSHIFITEDLSVSITTEDKIRDLSTSQEYEITFVDDVMGLGHHMEIYCKKVA